jgi:DNA-binding response OmpR family regulator
MRSLLCLKTEERVFYNRGVLIAPASRAAVTVLVVEDDRQTRELHRSALSHAGYTVVAVEDGVDALRYLDTHTPDAVVLDLGLPCLAGRDVGREMAAHGLTDRVPLIVVTGEDGTINEPDFACVLRKPIDPDKLVTTVENCIRDRNAR